MKHTISVVIPVYNEERYIEKCLESIASQTAEIKEIIVVDDGSKDNSKFKIQSFDFAQDKNSKLQFKIKNVRLLEQSHQGPAVARNLGAREATGDILVFLDADMVYDQNYIVELVGPITKGNEIATFTRSEFVGNLHNTWARFWDAVTAGQNGKRVIAAGKRSNGFRAIRADSFRRVGGYESFGYRDDGSVLEKLGRQSLAIDTARCWHFNPETLTEVFYSVRWIGREPGNRNNWYKFLVFSPFWSLLKGIGGAIKYRSFQFIPFRLVFDTGYLTGLVDATLGRGYSK